MATRRAAWMCAAWMLTAGGCTTLVGLDDSYHLEGAGGEAGAGAGGEAGAGGDAGTGGGEVDVPTDVELIDDMEDGDSAIDEAGGRVGYWYSFNDGTGTQTPPVYSEENPVGFIPETLAEPRGESTMAMHTFGSGFTEWGAGFGFALNGPDGGRLAYDASAYSGIVFWAKLGDAGAATTMKVNITDKTSDPAGGICDESGEDVANPCFDDWSTTTHLGAEWAPVVIPFEEFARGGEGAEPTAEPIDLTGLFAIEFGFTQGEDFDVYIDDVGFYP
ncbi:carbohydrate binding domain-containing protein [Sorangium atrum]|uniref:Carbohydrate binding domain-containing protein n=1 Tax=Sorangium atrum TaxID=2995308 RepID=A0ABT5C4G1_9BACT|nr:carbohydrate binding domain-containing protein [Sorangium aterium]MDC0680823.1 carbohydrate binding domain-containing protein [Sorangium aterium]